MELIKREILTSREVLYMKSRTQSVIVFQKRGFPKYGFFSPKMSAWVKKIDTACLKIFQVSADKGMGK